MYLIFKEAQKTTREFEKMLREKDGFTVVGYYAIYNSDYYLRSSVPQIVGGIVFILIGFYMMKSGVKKS